MAWRSGHGNGRGKPRIETLPPDELPHATAALAEPLAIDRDAAGRVKGTEAARALAKLPRRPALLRAIDCDSRFAPYNRRRLASQRARVADYRRRFGTLSQAVESILASASWASAGAEYLAELGAESGDPEWLGRAVQWGQVARQHDLAAWELACREAEARKARDRDDPNYQAKLSAMFGSAVDDSRKAEPTPDTIGQDYGDAV